MRYPKKGGGLLCKRIKARFDFIRQQIKAYPITLQCAVMRVSRSGFFACLDLYNHGNENKSLEVQLSSRIKEIFDYSRAIYGSRRIVKELHKDGRKIGHYMVRPMMRKIELKAHSHPVQTDD